MGWSVIGLALLTACRLDVSEMRVVLTAPALGSVVVVLLLFAISRTGSGLDTAGAVAIYVLIGVAALFLIWRRPAFTADALVIAAICVASLLVIGAPLFQFGFDWIGNANDDMANYVLAATKLLHHGLLGPLDVVGLTHDRDVPGALQVLHSAGARPGSEIELAGFSSAVGRPPYAMFMPFILALNLCVVCGAGALAAATSRRRFAPLLAAILMAVSPLATYGVTQQLVAQVWGLAIAAALLALLFRVDLHLRPARGGQILVIAVVAAGLVLVYVEMAATLAVAYAIFVAVLALRRQTTASALIRLWAPTLLLTVLALNTYLPRELRFAVTQASHGLQASKGHLFGYALVPTALPAVVGLQTLDVSTAAPHISTYIIVAAAILAVVMVAAIRAAWRLEGAAVAVVAYMVLAVVLGLQAADFGLFKLYMYVQPFAVAVVATAVARLSGRLLAAAVVVIAVVLGVQLRTQNVYVDRSRNPIDLPQASSPSLLPVVRRALSDAGPVLVSYAENPTLAKMEAAGAGDAPLLLGSRDIVGELLTVVNRELLPPSLLSQMATVRRHDGWKVHSFDLHVSGGAGNQFAANTHADEEISSGKCRVALPTGTELPFNRALLHEGSGPIAIRHCSGARNLLAFIQSDLGEGFYLARRYRTISFFQLQPDYFFRSRTFSGFGRYVLFRVLNPTAGSRIKLSLTTTLRHDGSNRIPPAVIIGADRSRLPLMGRGAARVYSAPVRTQMIEGVPYLMVDMGINGTRLPVSRPGLTGLYGGSVPLDPRYLTSYVRDISLVSDAAYRALKAPKSLSRFPADLASPSTVYSGIYEDGWIGEDCYAVLAGGRRTRLVVKADALQLRGQRLDVFVNGKLVTSNRVAGGALEVRVPIPASTQKRRVELRFAKLGRLRAPDLRPATARLLFFGLVDRG